MRERRLKGEKTRSAEQGKSRELAGEINAYAVTELRPAAATEDADEGRRRASGTSCAAVDPDDLVLAPAIPDAANPGPLCRRFQRRAGVA